MTPTDPTPASPATADAVAVGPPEPTVPQVAAFIGLALILTGFLDAAGEPPYSVLRLFLGAAAVLAVGVFPLADWLTRRYQD